MQNTKCIYNNINVEIVVPVTFCACENQKRTDMCTVRRHQVSWGQFANYWSKILVTRFDTDVMLYCNEISGSYHNDK